MSSQPDDELELEPVPVLVAMTLPSGCVTNNLVLEAVPRTRLTRALEAVPRTRLTRALLEELRLNNSGKARMRRSAERRLSRLSRAILAFQ